MSQRSIHPDFQFYLDLKERELIELYYDLRSFVLEIDPDASELLYNTHALTSVYSTSDKLSEAYCMIPIYSSHLNLGFNQGTLLSDPDQLLVGTGKLIRHITIKSVGDYRNKSVEKLIKSAIELSREEMFNLTSSSGQTISKIKR